jgi:hypothetical protein
MDTDATRAVLAIRLRRSASFLEKLRQLVDKYSAKKAPGGAFFEIAETQNCRNPGCGKFERSD